MRASAILVAVACLAAHVVAYSVGVVTYFSDPECTKQGGGPPGLIANPFETTIGTCSVLLKSGFSIRMVSCADAVSVDAFADAGCTHAVARYTSPVGQCVNSSNIFRCFQGEREKKARNLPLVSRLRFREFRRAQYIRMR